MNKENISFIKPFGPTVAKVIIPAGIIESLNNYFDETASNKNQLKKMNFGPSLAGNVTNEISLSENILKKSGWMDFLSKSVSNYIKFSTGGKQITKFHIVQSWIVSQFEHEYNQTHWHYGHLSGAGYLKVPKNLGKPIQENKKPMPNGCLQLIHGSHQFLSPSTFTIQPKVGEFYIFPNYLMHTVFPFSDTKEERRCISFNALIDENIYDVYR